MNALSWNDPEKTWTLVTERIEERRRGGDRREAERRAAVGDRRRGNHRAPSSLRRL